MHDPAVLTEYSRNKSERKLRTEHRQYPWGRIQCRRHIVAIQPLVQIRNVVAHQPGQLIQLQLEFFHVGQIFCAHLSSEH